MRGEPGQSTPSHGPAQLTVEFVTRSSLWDDRGLALDALSAAAGAAYEAAGGDRAAEAVVVLWDDMHIRELNHRWAGKDKATDVLSFPADDDGRSPELPLGDIVLAFETVQRDAAESGLSLTAHASHLVIHGLLHLLGYDHSGEREAAVMESLESEVLGRLGLHDPYALPADANV